MTSTQKIVLAVAVSFFMFVPYALAQGFVPLAPIPGLTDVQPTSGGLATFFNNLYKFMIGIAAALAVIMITWAGLKIALNRDNVSTIMDSKGTIYNAVFGLVLVLSPYLVFSIINPSILNLSLNLPRLNTSAAPPLQISATTDTTLPDIALESRESSGGSVVFAFTPTWESMQSTPIGNILDAKQDECTSVTNRTGVVLPVTTGDVTGYGGIMSYACQTCPPNTTLELFPRGRTGSGPRGSCVTQ
ncbi:hypothetical protein A3C94_02165 [Candidatus Kaiserbacteria bacterium RIFCSPHIGHO2_02_FULL_55_17]|uniref:Uncharacterized protein n=1 Tax=Candidatus Kaiserbacteria bacterium RIFCSPHIGHO2_02_FULL_55_17 TaxID=1798496 RepID=A0A1F6DUE7_9BACT|nr:MAG: hypothetical protein A3C94_02165 [Candidatus Kaiserbacteria bacterium RIFCSPHIGHO2_02_FULL_55_17]